MKKISLFIALMLSLIVSACSQQTQQPAESQTSRKAEEVKPAEQPKSNFPEKPIEMILPIPPGSSYDTAARALSQAVTKYLPNGQSVVVVNKPGGGNTLGAIDVFQAKPDGYKIGFVPSSAITVQPHYGQVPYQHDSFQTIMRVLQVDGFLYVHADSPWKDFDEWFSYVKQNPDKFSVGIVQGAKPVMTRLNKEAGIKMKIVTFDGSGPAMTAFLGRHVQAMIGAPTPQTEELLQSGKIRALFSTSGRETGDIPSLKSKRINIEENRMVGIIAPKGIPSDVQTILHDAFKKALEDPQVVEQFKKLKLESAYGSAEEFQKDLSDNFLIDGDNLKAAGLIK